jgi:hypothetical protein
MTKVALYLAGLLLVAIAAACGDGGAAPDERQEDAASILREAQTAMRGLDSFRAALTIETDEGRSDYTIEWQRSDSFHIIMPWEEGNDGSVGEEGVSETIVMGDRSYARQCKAEAEDCSEWTEGERGDIDFPAPSPGFDPRWPIVALGLIAYERVAGQYEVGGVPCIGVAGSVNHLRAVYQALEEGLRQRGVTTYGQACTARPGEPEECRDVPIEEFMDREAEDIRRGDENLGRVLVCIGQEDRLMHRYTAMTGTRTSGTFTYSRFNQVGIEPPE